MVGILPVRQSNLVAVTTGVREGSLMRKHRGAVADEGRLWRFRVPTEDRKEY